MQVFIYTVELPEQSWDDRVINLVDKKTSDILRWNVKELNYYYSGEFSWKKLGLFGVCAMQYINPKLVKLIVNARDEEMATSMVRSFSWHIDAKKFHKRKYAPRQSKTNITKAA